MESYIQSYIRQDIKIFACNSDKTPATSTGFYSATADIASLKIQFKDLEKREYLIGMPTGNGNNIVVVDIDINKESNTRTVDELLEELQTYGDIPDTFQVQTPSGGRHLWFTVPYTGLSSKRRFFDKTLPVDVRANGGYAIIPDGKSDYVVYDDVENLEIENIRKRCAELPSWIENFQRTEYHEIEENILPETEIREIRSALAYLNSDDRDMWIRIGMALKSTGSPSAKGLWDEWSQKSDKYKAKDQEKRWRTLKPREEITIASIFHEAKKFGWLTTYEKKTPELIVADIIEEEVEIKKEERKPFPEHLLSPPGLVGELMTYINDQAIKEQPIFSLAASLCAIGALEGRKIQTETGIRPNIYCLGVGVSGSGKEAARGVIKNLFHHAGCGELASVEDIASDASIVTNLKENPSQVFLLDEIGRFLKTTTQATKNPHLYNIISVLLKLYSSANGVFYGKIYAERDQVRIDNPNLCLYGTTVPDTLYKGLTVDNITDGLLSRILIFETEEPDPPKKPRRNLTHKPPLILVEKIKILKNKKINLKPDGNLDQFNVKPQIVELNENAVELLHDFDTSIRKMREELRDNNRIDAVYNRTSQMAEQIALILAGGMNIDMPIITEKEMIYGIELVKYLSDNMLYITENFIADNDYHHSVKFIHQIIKSCGKISLSEITRRTQHIQGYVRNDIIETLKSSDEVIEYSEGEGVTKKRIFKAK